MDKVYWLAFTQVRLSKFFVNATFCNCQLLTKVILRSQFKKITFCVYFLSPKYLYSNKWLIILLTPWGLFRSCCKYCFNLMVKMQCSANCFTSFLTMNKFQNKNKNYNQSRLPAAGILTGFLFSSLNYSYELDIFLILNLKLLRTKWY